MYFLHGLYRFFYCIPIAYGLLKNQRQMCDATSKYQNILMDIKQQENNTCYELNYKFISYCFTLVFGAIFM